MGDRQLCSNGKLAAGDMTATACYPDNFKHRPGTACDGSEIIHIRTGRTAILSPRPELSRMERICGVYQNRFIWLSI